MNAHIKTILTLLGGVLGVTLFVWLCDVTNGIALVVMFLIALYVVVYMAYTDL